MNFFDLREEFIWDAGFKNFITSIKISSDNKYLISASSGNSVQILDLLDRKQIFVLEGHTKLVSSIVMTSDNKFLVSGSEDKTIRIWNVLDKKQEAVLKGHTDIINFVKIVADNKYIISCSSDKTIRLWNFSEKTQEKVIKTGMYAKTIAATSNGKYAIISLLGVNCYIFRCVEKIKKTFYRK